MFVKAVRLFLVAALLIAALYFLVLHPRPRSSGRPSEIPSARSRRDFDQTRPRGHEHETEPPLQTPCDSRYFAQWQMPAPDSCAVRQRNGYTIPDPRCTPGGMNPSVTADTLRNPSWRTREVRNCAESEAQKHVAYRWYQVQKPRINSNQNQVCELDHLVPLELGGADGMGNIWPQCGPDAVALNQRYFKQKDHVENYLAEEVKAGRMPLADAQRGIARDWTQYLSDADLWCGRTGRC